MPSEASLAQSVAYFLRVLGPGQRGPSSSEFRTAEAHLCSLIGSDHVGVYVADLATKAVGTLLAVAERPEMISALWAMEQALIAELYHLGSAPRNELQDLEAKRVALVEAGYGYHGGCGYSVLTYDELVEDGVDVFGTGAGSLIQFALLAMQRITLMKKLATGQHEKRATPSRVTAQLSKISDTFAYTAYQRTVFSFDLDGSGSETRAGHPCMYPAWTAALQGGTAKVHKHAVPEGSACYHQMPELTHHQFLRDLMTAVTHRQRSEYTKLHELTPPVADAQSCSWMGDGARVQYCTCTSLRRRRFGAFRFSPRLARG